MITSSFERLFLIFSLIAAFLPFRYTLTGNTKISTSTVTVETSLPHRLQLMPSVTFLRTHCTTAFFRRITACLAHEPFLLHEMATGAHKSALFALCVLGKAVTFFFVVVVFGQTLATDPETAITAVTIEPFFAHGSQFMSLVANSCTNGATAFVDLVMTSLVYTPTLLHIVLPCICERSIFS